MKKDAYRIIGKIYDIVLEPAITISGLRKSGLKIYPPHEGMKVLDVGCGTGTQLSLYHQTGCEVYGIDSSPTMVECSRKKLGSAANIRVEDASHMSFSDGNFDLVTLVFTIHEMRSRVRKAVLHECKRVLKDDGRILIIDYHLGPLSFPSGWIWKLVVLSAEIIAGREHYMNYKEYRAARGLPPLINELGFIIYTEWIRGDGNSAIYLLGK